MKKTLLICATFIFSLFLVAQFADAQDKITGPWLWLIAPCEAGQGGQASTDLDQLDEASRGKVTEEDVAEDGAKKGDKVGDLKWVEAEISDSGGNNIQDMINANKNKWGGGWKDLPADINDYSAYGLITIESAKAQNNVTMRVGSDDSIKVWLNGEVVHTNAVNRGASDFQDTFEVDFKKGDNLLLVKSSERGGGWSVFVGINADYTAAGKDYGFQVPPPPAGEKVTGPWLWMTAPTTNGLCGASATETDWLNEASKGKVTEEKIAKNGVKKGDKVGDLKWTEGMISATGGNNINDLVTQVGLGAGDINNHVAYAYINVISPKTQNTHMYVGSDDAIKVWLNGKVVWENPVNRGAGDYQENFRVTLIAGDNPLVVAVYECGGGWSMFAGFAEGLKLDFNTKAASAHAVEPDGKMPTTWGNIKQR